MVDTVKILGSLLSSGALSGGSGGSVLGNLLGAALGGNQSSGLGSILGGLMGGNSQQSSGGLGGMLGSLLGGAAQQQRTNPQSGGGLTDILGSLLGGAAQQQRNPQMQPQGGGLTDILGGLLGGGANNQAQTPNQGGGLGDLLGGLMGGNNTQARPQMNTNAGGGIGDLLGGLLGSKAASNGPDLGSLLGGAVSKYMGTQNPDVASLSTNFIPPTADQQAVDDQAQLLIRTMINAAKADGKIDETEQERILSKLSDLTEDEANFIRQEFQAPLDVNGFIRSIPPAMGQQIYAMSLMAIDLDTQQEARYLQQLAQGLNLSPQVCNQLHDQVGAPKIFA